jgi:hypothetical protein
MSRLPEGPVRRFLPQSPQQLCRYHLKIPEAYGRTVRSISDLIAVIQLSCMVFLDNGQRFCLDLLVRRKTLAAVIALSSSSNGIIIFCRSRIDHAGTLTSTIWASHLLSPPYNSVCSITLFTSYFKQSFSIISTSTVSLPIFTILL